MDDLMAQGVGQYTEHLGVPAEGLALALEAHDGLAGLWSVGVQMEEGVERTETHRSSHNEDDTDHREDNRSHPTERAESEIQQQRPEYDAGDAIGSALVSFHVMILSMSACHGLDSASTMYHSL
jgi:hypothetical protein